MSIFKRSIAMVPALIMIIVLLTMSVFAVGEADYTVNFYLAGTTVKVADSVTGSAPIDSSVTVSAPTLSSAYANAVKLSGDESFVVATGDNTVNWYYQVPLTVTAADASKTYDGTALTKADIASVTGLINGDEAAKFGATMTSDSTITNAGTKANKIATLTYNGGTVPAYYKVTRKDGTLTISPLPITVRVVGHTLETDYNGQVQKVEGYDWRWDIEEAVTVAMNFYTDNDFTLSGEAVIEQKNVNRALPIDPVEEYMMGLDNNRFANVNNNFTVTFEVTDGSLTIKPINADVVVTPNTIKEKYTGEEKKITATVTKESKDPLYDPKKLVAHPTEGWTKTVTAAGTYDFDIKPKDFENTDPNFEVVEVTVEQNKPLVVMPKLTVRYWLGEVGGEEAAPTAERWAAGGTEVNVETPNIVGWQPDEDLIKWTAPKGNRSEGESETYIDVVFAPAVVYIGADQTAKTLKEPYTIIDSDYMPITWTAGWYVVKGTVNYPIGGITCSGEVHLILTDGCALTVKGADYNAGIRASGDSNSLTIYGQTNGTGALEATGGDGGAGIGCGHGRADNNITINGGTVTATGGDGGAGIGSGSEDGSVGAGNNITINGGVVTATGGKDGGAGIGGGFCGAGSNITINGGYINASGKDGGAGIGGGNCGHGRNITISGGYINAKGTNGGASIGGGNGGTASGIELKGGCYTNKPDSKYIPTGYYSGDNTDTATKADYPYIIQQADGCLVLDGDYPGTFSADGKETEATVFSGKTYIKVPDGAQVLTYYEFNAGSDAHGTYPVSMKVWLLSQDAGSGEWIATELTELENLLSYCGTSIRTTGKKGVRLVTGINGSLKKQLIAGLGGYTLSEYGTVMAWTDRLSGEGLTLNDPNGVSNYAYSRANRKDPVFRTVKGVVQYTNVLVFDSLPDTSLARDITMRPYVKLLDAQGSELVIYGGELVRSVGYVAYQNRNAFKPGTREYEYIWKIILAAYGEQYLDEYVSK